MVLVLVLLLPLGTGSHLEDVVRLVAVQASSGHDGFSGDLLALEVPERTEHRGLEYDPVGNVLSKQDAVSCARSSWDVTKN